MADEGKKPEGERKPDAGKKPEPGGKPGGKPEGKAHKPQAPKGGGGGEKAKGEGGGHVKPSQVRLREKYVKEVVPALQAKFQFKNPMAVPRLKKVCLNMGFGKAATENNQKIAEQCLTEMTTITGQKAVLTKARKSISNFKLREGMTVGCRVTLRGMVMYEFFDRLVNVAIPRIRDFRGLPPRAFDGRGNYSLGLQEQTVFPEIETDRVDVVHGMDITICTSAKKDEHALELLRALGMPFRER